MQPRSMEQCLQFNRLAFGTPVFNWLGSLKLGGSEMELRRGRDFGTEKIK